MATRANDGTRELPNILPKLSAEEQKQSRLTWMNSRITMPGSLQSRSSLTVTTADHLCTALALRRLRRCGTIISSRECHHRQFSRTTTIGVAHMMRPHEVPCRIHRLPPLSITSSSISIMTMPRHILKVAEATTRATLAKTINKDMGQLRRLSNHSVLAVQIQALHQP